MIFKIKTNNNQSFLYAANNRAYVYGGIASTGTGGGGGEENPITQNYFITLIDESDPGYASNEGTIVGELWESDVLAFNNSNINSDSVITFDIGNRPQQIGQTIVPNNGVGSQSPVSNIISTTRPTAGDPTSQNNLYNFLKTTIENLWGSDFWSRMSNSEYKLIIIVDTSGSLNRNIVGDGLDTFETFLTNAGVSFDEYNVTANERWLQWILQIFENPDLPTDTNLSSCISGEFCLPDITSAISESACTHSLNTESSGYYIRQPNEINPKVLIDRNAPPGYSYYFSNNASDQIVVSKKIKITVDDPIFGGTYIFTKDSGNNSIQADPNSWYLDLDESSFSLNDYVDTSTTAYINKYGGSYTPFAEPYLNGKPLVVLYEVEDPTLPYQGYLEYTITQSAYSSGGADYYKGTVNDVFAYPCQFIFMAVQPPSDGDDSQFRMYERFVEFANNDPVTTSLPSATTSRFVAGFNLPLQYRQSYGDWGVVDYQEHTVAGIPANYFNNISRADWYYGYGSTPPGLVHNSYYFNIYGMPPQNVGPTDPVNYTFTPNNSSEQDNSSFVMPKEYLGFAFSVTGSGGGFVPYFLANTASPVGEYTFFPVHWSPVFGLVNNPSIPTYTVMDNRSLFGPKTPSRATIEFVNKCNIVRCPTIPSLGTLASTSGIYEWEDNQCMASLDGTTIVSDYLCGGDLIAPNDAYFGEGKTFKIVLHCQRIKQANGSTYGSYVGVVVNPNFTLTTYDIDDATETTYIELPYTPTNAADVRAYINTTLNIIAFRNDKLVDKFRYIDLLWIENGSNVNAVVIPRLEGDLGQTIEVFGAGTSGANGVYQYHRFNPDLPLASASGHIYIKTASFSSLHNTFISSENDSHWNIVKDSGIWHIINTLPTSGDEISCPQSFYSLSGISESIPTTASVYWYGDTFVLDNSAYDWSNSGLAGLNPVPTSVVDFHGIGFYSFPQPLSINYLPVNTGIVI